MLIIADKRVPEKAKQSLKLYGDIIFLETESITYQAISGHPDIFFCNTGKGLVVAPNLPDGIKQQMKESGLHFTEGNFAVGLKYPLTAQYNAVVTDNFLIHNLKNTDKKILDLTVDLVKIDVRQAYTRCNLLPLNENSFITSDKGIEKTLLKEGLDVLYVSPAGIELPGFDNGFFGGACGVYDGKVFILGSLSKFGEGDKVRAFINDRKMEIVELYEGGLFDGGSILFV